MSPNKSSSLSNPPTHIELSFTLRRTFVLQPDIEDLLESVCHTDTHTRGSLLIISLKHLWQQIAPFLKSKILESTRNWTYNEWLMSKIIPCKICMKQIHHCQAHSLLTHLHGEDFQTLSKVSKYSLLIPSTWSIEVFL